MTHTLSGNLILPTGFKEYNKEKVNHRVLTYSRRRLECYFCRRDEKFRISMYEKNGEQPFIEVFDRPVRTRRWLSNIEDCVEGLLAVRVRSGSHVGFSDTELAREIYDTAMQIRTNLGRILPVMLYFDDERKLYLPREFLREIRKR